jgi:hypothetical protein
MNLVTFVSEKITYTNNVPGGKVHLHLASRTRFFTALPFRLQQTGTALASLSAPSLKMRT